jgi:hypothetical protein
MIGLNFYTHEVLLACSPPAIPHTSSPPPPILLFPYLLFHSYYFYYLSFNLYENNIHFPNTPMFIANTAKGFVFHINNWFHIEFMNLLFLSYTSRSVNRYRNLTNNQCGQNIEIKSRKRLQTYKNKPMNSKTI